MYMAFVGPQDWEEYQPGSAGASARYFDGDSDYVMLPRMNGRNKQPKRSFAEMTIDVWVKVFDFASPHPIMNVRLSSLRRDARLRRALCPYIPRANRRTTGTRATCVK